MKRKKEKLDMEWTEEFRAKISKWLDFQNMSDTSLPEQDRKEISEWMEALKEKTIRYLDHKYPEREYVDKYGEKVICNIGPHGIGFWPCFYFNSWGAVLIEYCDTYDDGDRFFPEDYSSFDEFMAAICKEIDEES